MLREIIIQINFEILQFNSKTIASVTIASHSSFKSIDLVDVHPNQKCQEWDDLRKSKV